MPSDSTSSSSTPSTLRSVGNVSRRCVCQRSTPAPSRSCASVRSSRPSSHGRSTQERAGSSSHRCSRPTRRRSLHERADTRPTAPAAPPGRATWGGASRWVSATICQRRTTVWCASCRSNRRSVWTRPSRSPRCRASIASSSGSATSRSTWGSPVSTRTPISMRPSTVSSSRPAPVACRSASRSRTSAVPTSTEPVACHCSRRPIAASSRPGWRRTEPFFFSMHLASSACASSYEGPPVSSTQ